MELELCLKNKIYISIITTYSESCYKKFKYFFVNKKIFYKYRQKIGGKTKFLLLEIARDDNLTDIVKLQKSLYLLHLPDVLKFLTDEKVYYKDNRLISKFYENKPSDFNYLKINKGHLVKLRNHIAHYNFLDYEKKRKNFIKALIFFEIHLGCSIKKLHDLPELSHKPNTMEILRAIYKIEPDLFSNDDSGNISRTNKDRRLCDLYDDLAVINGWGYHELKSH